MPTPMAYETGENFNGPHTAGNKYVQSFGGDELGMEKRNDDYDNFEGGTAPHVGKGSWRVLGARTGGAWRPGPGGCDLALHIEWEYSHVAQC